MDHGNELRVGERRPGVGNTLQRFFDMPVGASTQVAAAVALAAGLIWVFRNGSVPVVSDEVGYLSIAKYIANGEILNVSMMAVYRFGQGVLLAPLALIATDAATLYRLCVAMSCLFTAAVPLVLVAIAKRLSIKVTLDVFLASIAVAVFPTYLYQSSLVWPEASLRFFFLLTIFFAISACTSRRPLQWVLFTLCVVWLFALHARSLAILPLAAVLVIWATIKQQLKLSVSILLLLILGLGLLSVVGIQEHIRGVLWSSGYGDAGQIRRLFGTLAKPDGLLRLTVAVMGQLWMLLASGYGLYSFGLIYMRQLRRTTPAAFPALLFALGATAAIFIASVGQMTQYSRVDHVIYSRYNDAGTTLFVWLGIVILLRRQLSYRWLALVGAIFSLLAIAMILLSPYVKVSGVVLPNIPSLAWVNLLWPLSGTTLAQLISFGSVVTLCALLWLGLTSGRLALGLMSIFAVANSAVVVQSANGAHVGMAAQTASSAAILSRFTDELYFDASARFNGSVYVDQFSAIDRPLASSDIASEDIPVGSTTIAAAEFRKDGYTCVARLPHGAVLLSRAESSPNCGGLEVPPVTLVAGAPRLFSDAGSVRGLGWSHPEPWGRWTDGSRATLEFMLPAAGAAGRTIEVEAVAYLGGSSGKQRVNILGNGSPMAEWVFTRETPRQINRLSIPADVDTLELELQLPDARSPSDDGVSRDPRRLGIAIVAVCLTTGTTCLSS